jgi:hypothetical protein
VGAAMDVCTKETPAKAKIMVLNEVIDKNYIRRMT